MRWQYKLPLSFILIIAVLALANVVGTNYSLRWLQESRLRTSELLLAESLAGQLYRRIIEQDVAVITQSLFDSKVMAKEKIAYILVFDRKGYLLAHTYIDTMPKQLFHLDHSFTGDKQYRIDRITTDEIHVYDIAVPVMEGIVQVGSVHLGIKQSFIDNAIVAAWRASLILIGMVAGVALIVGFIVSRAITVPIRELCRVSREVGNDHLDVRADIRSRDDFRELGEAFNAMISDVQLRNQFIRRIFGRYLSDDIADQLLEKPEALSLGGEKRCVTIMITDLRGFTAISERLNPEQVVQMLNTYFEVMVEIVLKYNGTINEIIGDSLLIIFGAPQEMEDRCQRAIACAIEMQNAMSGVNKQNLSQGLSDLEMGIGLNETEVIVGNIGSSKRSKYAVVGSGVNMTSRIESYTVGGQILISESVRREAGEILLIDAQRDVLPKGSETPVRIYEVGGIAGPFNLALEKKEPSLFTLAMKIPLRYSLLEGKDAAKKKSEGFVVRLSKNCAEISLCAQVEIMANLKMNLMDVDEKLSARYFYGKVVKQLAQQNHIYVVRFTSIPSEIDSYFQAILKYHV
jgi:adenylate cyclase